MFLGMNGEYVGINGGKKYGLITIFFFNLLSFFMEKYLNELYYFQTETTIF